MSQPNRTHLPTDYDLTLWYLNARRIIEIILANSIASDTRRIGSLGKVDDATRKNITLSVLKDGLMRLLRASDFLALGQLLVSGNLQPASYSPITPTYRIYEFPGGRHCFGRDS